MQHVQAVTMADLPTSSISLNDAKQKPRNAIGNVKPDGKRMFSVAKKLKEVRDE